VRYSEHYANLTLAPIANSNPTLDLTRIADNPLFMLAPNANSNPNTMPN